MPNPNNCKTKTDNRVWFLYNESVQMGKDRIKARKLECVIQEIGLKVLYFNYLRSDTP